MNAVSGTERTWYGISSTNSTGRIGYIVNAGDITERYGAARKALKMYVNKNIEYLDAIQVQYNHTDQHTNYSDNIKKIHLTYILNIFEILV